MELGRIAELARQDAGRRFCSIAHFLTQEALWGAFASLRKDAAAGVDGVTYADYEGHLVENLCTLYEKLKSKSYRAQPLRRIYIDKEDGRKRPISIPALEDKIVQRATVELLNAIFEQDFLDCSYGFRPGRSAHDALDEVGRVICRRPTQYVLELDICSYFDSIVREHLMEMIGRRVSDASILRLIGKWINVGVIEDGRLLQSETGTGQGQIISPLLANLYLHHVLDRWFKDEVKPRLKGQAYEIRYADDALLCFQHREDAQRVLEVLPKRFAKYGLTLHPQKTRLVEFGRHAHDQAKRLKTKPATFDFLGFTHRCATSRNGKFTVHVGTMKKRLRRGLKAVADWCQQHRHDPVDYQQRRLNAKLRGHYQYYGRPTNYRSLWKFFRAVRRLWRTGLNRRTRGRHLTWERFAKLLARFPLLCPSITRAWSAR
jgi:group II intron reverse transcriptase/maturase